MLQGAIGDICKFWRMDKVVYYFTLEMNSIFSSYYNDMSSSDTFRLYVDAVAS